jgi:hypothetical protein
MLLRVSLAIFTTPKIKEMMYTLDLTALCSLMGYTEALLTAHPTPCQLAPVSERPLVPGPLTSSVIHFLSKCPPVVTYFQQLAMLPKR